MTPEGLGLFIHKIHRCESGVVSEISHKAHEGGFRHILIKIAHGSEAYNVDLAGPLVDSLKGCGLKVLGWQWIRGDAPREEAKIAAHRINNLGLDGFVCLPDLAYCKKQQQAEEYLQNLRARIPPIPLGISAHRYPLHFPDFPWQEFLDRSDFVMPRIFWMHSSKPISQLEESVRQYRKFFSNPIIPTGPAFEDYGWKPETAELVKFLAAIKTEGFPAVNFWLWDYAGSPEGQQLWRAMTDPAISPTSTTRDIVEKLFTCLNDGDLEKAAHLYNQNARIVTRSGIYQGRKDLFTFFNVLISEREIARFTYQIMDDQGNVRYIKWNGFNAAGDLVLDDIRDTLLIQQGLLQYHASGL